jgi:hypothetical protein
MRYYLSTLTASKGQFRIDGFGFGLVECTYMHGLGSGYGFSAVLGEPNSLFFLMSIVKIN